MDNYTVIEKYRKTAAMMRRAGKPVTVTVLADALRQSPNGVARTIRRREGRAAYVGIVSRFDATALRYRAALAEIPHRPVTKSMLARKLGITLRGVQVYLRKHPHVFDGMPVQVVDHHVNAGAAERYRAAAVSLRKKRLPVTRKMLAYEMLIGRTAVNRYIRLHPALAKEIGVVHTWDL